MVDEALRGFFHVSVYEDPTSRERTNKKERIGERDFLLTSTLITRLNNWERRQTDLVANVNRFRTCIDEWAYRRT